MKKITRFLAGAWIELKRVKWPTFSEAVRYTIAVLSVLVFFSLFSYGIHLLMSFVVTKFGA